MFCCGFMKFGHLTHSEHTPQYPDGFPADYDDERSRLLGEPASSNSP